MNQGYFAMCAFADYDNDGWLDLFATTLNGASTVNKNFLFRNNGDGTLSTVDSAPFTVDAGAWACGAWGDYDGDGFLDLFVANNIANSQSVLYHNNRDGTFTRITNGVIATDRGNCNSAAWADYDNDGLLDLFVANVGSLSNRLYHNEGGGRFSSVAAGPILKNVPGGSIHGVAWGDYDNDGFLDLFVANEFGNNLLFHNNGDGTFSQITTGNLITMTGNKGACCWVDYDNDGFLDLFVTRGGDNGLQSNLLYHNEGNSNNWIKVHCVGTVSNRSAIGAKVRVKATVSGKTFWQLREITGGSGWSTTSPVAHFGLGDATNVQTLRIEWPSGTVQEFSNVAARQFLTITEPSQVLASMTNGLQLISVRGGRNLQYDIQTSTDLAAWSALNALTITNINGVANITVTNAPGSSPRFYRAVLH
jgi:hypothetical protein